MTEFARSAGLAGPDAEARLRRRYAAERRFRFYGQAAIGAAILFLVFLIGSIVTQALPAFTQHKVAFDLQLDRAVVAPSGRAAPEDIRENVAGFYRLVREDLVERFPEGAGDASDRVELYSLATRLAVLPVAHDVARDPSMIGQTRRFWIALSDDLDLYLKGLVTRENVMTLGPVITVEVGRGDDSVVLTVAEAAAERIRANAPWSEPDRFLDGDPTVLIQAGDVVLKALELDGPEVKAEVLTGDLAAPNALASSPLTVRTIQTPETDRNVTDRQIAWTLALKSDGRIERRLNTALTSNADSTYPEIAGVFAALVGSLFTMLITASLAVPIGIMAAVYLEEFAPKTRMTDVIEVSINNLAAVPSIVYGLLGAAVFLNFFGLPRSAPFVGGLVLALMTLPTVIIAARAALKAVPPSIRDAALGVGASKTQAVFHHALPLAAPGIMTGAIIGLARALGETAPLLLIGMVAFVAEAPSGPTDEATVLPVLIYKWSTGAERAWEPATAAAIIILLIFMVFMNAVAVLLRRRFERRW
ncbi:MAG: phosphate ABC transporter permease PstA [Pseudomonadota bacterium]